MQVMKTRKQVLRSEHSDTLSSMNNLACTRKFLGKVEDALLLMEQCVQLCSKQLGLDHPDTLSSSETLREWQQEYSSSSNESPQASAQSESGQLPSHISEHLTAVSVVSRARDERVTEPPKSESETIRP